MKYIDLRSDTVTKPTEEMRKAMFNAEVGDDVYGDDPSVNELEAFAAELVGKEASLFVPSGTFGNQLCLLTHCKRGDEVIVGDDSHIVIHEVGASSVIAGVQLRTVLSDKGELNPKDVESRIRGNDIHFPSTGLICLENAHSNGRVVSLQNMKEIHEIARKHNIPTHLDGARLFNAGEYLKVSPEVIASYFDSVTFCLSKGLCAPVGSIVAGTKMFIDNARKGRKLMGGGLRQSGILAAAGLVALKQMAGRLGEDHENALYLAKRLTNIPGISLNIEDIHINMVFFTMKSDKYNIEDLYEDFMKKGIKINPPENGELRFVTNYWINKEDIDYVVEVLEKLIV